MPAILLLATVVLIAAPALQPIEQSAALRLIEARLPKLQASAIQRVERNNRPVYEIRGTANSAAILAVVDADKSRILRIEEDGKLIYEWNGIAAVGHRGAIALAPENTIVAFEKAIELGADMVEMDVRETRDGQLIVMHDETVNRTTGGTGTVLKMTLKEIKALDGGRVPTLKEALNATKGRALPDIHFKAGDPAKLIATIREAGLQGKVTLACDDLLLLRRTLQLDPQFIARPTLTKGRAGLPSLLRQWNPAIVNIDWPLFSPEVIRDVHLANKLAFVNTLGAASDNATSMQKAIDAGADYIQTDNLTVLIPLLRKQGLHQ